MSPDEYLQERLDDQIKWYDKKSAWNQKCFKQLRAVEILFSVTVPFLISQIGGDSSPLKMKRIAIVVRLSLRQIQILLVF